MNNNTNRKIRLDKRSIELRKTITLALGAAGRGHLGPAFSCMEIVRVLYDDVLRFRADDPAMIGRDRFILSKGHGCLALYVMLADKRFFCDEELQKICTFDGLLGGHPETSIPGVEACTGSLGHGLSIGIGMALNAKMKNIDYRVFVLLGDGECNEGSVWEGALSAAKHKLHNLTVIIDHNKSQAYGPSGDVLNLEPLSDKWRSFGFEVMDLDGHDIEVLKKAFTNRVDGSEKPTALICHTIKGKGAILTENNMQWHHKNKITGDDVEKLINELESQ